MSRSFAWPAAALLLACSRGTGGEGPPIDPEPDASATTGTGGAQPEINYHTANKLYSQLPGEYDSSRQSEEDPTLVPKHLWACRLDAPELGERVVYLERSDLETIDSPYFQLIVAIDASSSEYDLAFAKLYVPDELGPWVGLCGGGDLQPMPTSVHELVGCDTGVSDSHTGPVSMQISGDACIPHAPEDALDGSSFLRIDYSVSVWRDEFRLEDGSLLLDPAGEQDTRPEFVLDRLGEVDQ